MFSRMSWVLAVSVLVGCPAEDEATADASTGSAGQGSDTLSSPAESGEASTADIMGTTADPDPSDTTSDPKPSTTAAESTGDDSESTSADGGSTDAAVGCADGQRNGDETDVDCGGSCDACPIGSACDDPADCADSTCETGSCLGQSPTCDPDDVQGNPGGDAWKDSYSVDGQCYCDSTFDHDIGVIEVMTPDGMKTVLEICEAIGAGPGAEGNPIYNDIQCGNGPANDAGDEDWCPGRVDQGQAGCCIVGPTWDLSVFE